MRPTNYRHSCTVSQEIPYSVLDASLKGSQPGIGTLNIGRVVWLDHALASSTSKASVQAYVDGIGLIQVDPTALSGAV